MSFRRKITRRQFIKGAAIAGGAVMMPGLGPFVRSAHAFYQTPSVIPLFGTDLRGIGTIGVAAPDLTAAPVTGVTHYTINIDQFSDAGVCPALGPTTLRGFNPTRLLAGQNNKHLGGIIVGKGRAPGGTSTPDVAQPIQITFRNNLPAGKHIIPNDLTIPGANQGNNRTAIHFHGGLVPWISDGGPFDWWDSAGNHGLSFLNNKVLNPTNDTLNSPYAEYYYPLNQSARFGWYHDHAFGITRINAYAGIASGLIIRDGFEKSLVGPNPGKGLPDYIELGGNEIPLVIQDKTFVGTNIGAVDPTWVNVVDAAAQTPGSLWYPHIYERNRWRLSGNAAGGKAGATLPDPSCIPEAFGDTMLVNGTTFPKVTVQARRYRLRFLNACNARFLNLQFYVADATPNGITLNPLTGVPTNAAAGLNPNTGTASVLQIGTEGGFLPFPADVPTNVPFNPLAPLTGSLLVAPAERPDILVDFSGVPKNPDGTYKSVILYNDAPAPFPAGDPRYDYFPGWNVAANPVNALTLPGYGPNSRVLMRFDVVAATGAADPTLNIGTATNLQVGNDPLFFPYTTNGNPVVNAVPLGMIPRQLTLNEDFDAYGRLEQLLGTNVPLKGNAKFGRLYLDAATETPGAGATEVWEVYNLTADTHPMHFHLVNVQILSRQVFQNYNGTPTFKGAATPPQPNETGWKETVMMMPGEVTRVMMQFTLPQIVNASGVPVDFTAIGGGMGAPPPSPRTGNNEYVWHCHILEHEEHDMMRPLVVLNPAVPITVTPVGRTVAVGAKGTYLVGNSVGYSVFSDTASFTPVITATGFEVTVPAGAVSGTVVTFTISDGTGRKVTATLTVQ